MNFRRFETCKLRVLSKITWLCRGHFEILAKYLEPFSGSRETPEVLSVLKQSHVAYTKGAW